MKNKKSVLGLGLIALVLVLGVGYAVVSEVFPTITGTASTKTEDLKVSFTGETTKEDATSGKVTASATADSLDAQITVVDLLLNETVSATYTIQNEETDVDAEISVDSITVVDNTNKTKDLSSYFTVTTDVDSSAKTIGAGNTDTVKVSVKLSKTPVDSLDATASITVRLKATPKEAQ